MRTPHRQHKPRRLRPGWLFLGVLSLYFLTLLVQDIYSLRHLTEQKSAIEKTLFTLKENCKQLAKEKSQLQQADYLEGIAREELGYSKRGEHVYFTVFPKRT